MHARELVELAALVAAHGPAVVQGRMPLSETGLEEYWAASKSRLDRWSRILKEAANQPTTMGPQRRNELRSVIEEVLAGEMLTRVWAAVLVAHDRYHGYEHGEPIARSVLVGHLEARHRVLRLLVFGPGVGAEEAVRLNHLRRRVERWTDMLIGYLMGLSDVSDLAVEPQRARDFAEDIRYRGELGNGRHAWTLLMASLRSSFANNLSENSPNADLNQRIASSVLSCFEPGMFDGTGLPQSLWLTRLMNAASDAQGMLDDLLTAETAATAPSEPAAPSTNRLAHRLRRLSD